MRVAPGPLQPAPSTPAEMLRYLADERLSLGDSALSTTLRLLACAVEESEPQRLPSVPPENVVVLSERRRR